MEKVEIAINTNSGYRATEMVADLRNAVETLFFPMKVVGYWDIPASDHRCPQAQLDAPCPHVVPRDDPKFLDYTVTVERDLDGTLDVYFPHAQVHVYIG